MDDNKKRIVIYGLLLLLGLILGIVIAIVFNNNDNNIVSDDTELVDKESDAIREAENNQDNSKALVDVKYAEDIVNINKIIYNYEYSINQTEEENDYVIRELYGKDKVIVTDIDKRIIKSYAFTTYLQSDYSKSFYMDYVSFKYGNWIYDAEKLNEEVLSKYKYLFKDGKIGYDSVSGCPSFKYNSKEKKYYNLGSCGYGYNDFSTNNYKYEFNDTEYVVYRHVYYKKLNINNNYKLVFKFDNNNGEKNCLSSPYCFDLYSIEKID